MNFPRLRAMFFVCAGLTFAFALVDEKGLYWGFY